MKNPKKNYKLIRCSPHGGWAPWSIVCVHLMNNISKEWTPIPSKFDEVQYDWTCPGCAPQPGQPVNMDNLRAVCIHCVKFLRNRAGLPNVGDEVLATDSETGNSWPGEVHDITPEGEYVVINNLNKEQFLCEAVELKLVSPLPPDPRKKKK